MADKTHEFMKELWDLLLSAQSEASGIPPALIREKKDEKTRKMEQIELAKKQLERIKGFSELPTSKGIPSLRASKDEKTIE